MTDLVGNSFLDTSFLLSDTQIQDMEGKKDVVLLNKSIHRNTT